MKQPLRTRYTLCMEPVTSVAAILTSAKVVKAIKTLAGDEATTLTKNAATAGIKRLLRHLQPTTREKLAGQAIRLFAEVWYRELEETTPLTSALPGYDDQLVNLLKDAAPEIAECMDPDKREVDLGPVERIWRGTSSAALPEDFNWARVALNYAGAIKKLYRNEPDLSAAYKIALQEQQAADIARIAGPSPGFDLDAYRNFLMGKCGTLQLAAMHPSTYDHDRKLTLWSVFVEPSVRESVPVSELPPEVLRRLRQQGYLGDARNKPKLEELLRLYQSSPIRPVLEILDLKQDRKTHVVVTGDPGSGKTSLLKYIALLWVNKNQGPVPLFIEMKEYVKDRRGFLDYCDSACGVCRLDALELEKLLKAGDAAFYLDGLDEIFDPTIRPAVIEEIAALAAHYPKARIVVTSRKIGYSPERLGRADFVHATLEDFDQPQMLKFIDRWHLIAEGDEKERIRLKERLSRAIGESAAVRELSGNPLLLTMMAILNRNQELPRDRVELYREASRVLLHEWDASRALAVDTFARQEKEALLRELAGDMQQAEGGLAGNIIDRNQLLMRFRTFLDQLGVGKSYEKAVALIDQLQRRNFILAYAGADQFCFVHRTFLEYFCAAWFVERVQVKREMTFDQLKEQVFGMHWHDEKWHEVLRLITGMVSAQDAGRLIQFLMAKDGGQVKLANLTLAAGCLYEVRNRKAIQSIDLSLWKRLTTDAICYEFPDINVGGIALEEKFDLRLRIIRWIAVAWRGEKTREWLENEARYNNGDYVTRWAAVHVIASGWPTDPRTFPFLKDRAQNDKSLYVRRTAVEELADRSPTNPNTIAFLKERAHKEKAEEVRFSAIEKLKLLCPGDVDVMVLIKAHPRPPDFFRPRID